MGVGIGLLLVAVKTVFERWGGERFGVKLFGLLSVIFR